VTTEPASEIPALTFDHIGIVVADLTEASPQLAALLGPVKWTRRFDDGGLGVSVTFARDRAGVVYELIAPYGDRSPVIRTLKSRNNLLNQLAYRTANLEFAASHLRARECVPVTPPAPAVAFGGARVQFFLTPFEFLIELIELETWTHHFA
jgi:methylmalonyl-CoA/ethylmalonyl-CoA epimerase